jgi:hypothetical protein
MYATGLDAEAMRAIAGLFRAAVKDVESLRKSGLLAIHGVVKAWGMLAREWIVAILARCL